MKILASAWCATFAVLILISVGAVAGTVDDARRIVHQLAGPETRGRAVATDLGAASDWLAQELARYGEVRRQPVEVDGGESNNLILLRDPGLEQAGWIVVTAHYDHLGVGEAGGPHEGQVYFGADDNASGCAVLLMAAAQLLDGQESRDRGLAFVLTTGEEQGLAGSRTFLESGPVDPAEIKAAINLDTVGRLGSGELTVFGVGSARVFSPALDGLNTVFRLDLQKVEQSSGASDDMAFVESEIPALHLFTGAWPEYHRPSDSVENIDYAGLVDLADFTAELVDYLADAGTSIDWVPSRPAAAIADPERATEGRRKVSFGSIPDFKFEGEGILLSGVLAGSPAADAGLQAGDRIVAFGEAPVTDLTDYSEAMKRHSPGDVVEVEFVREGETHRVEVTLVERR
jgi:aminopeptidase N